MLSSSIFLKARGFSAIFKYGCEDQMPVCLLNGPLTQGPLFNAPLARSTEYGNDDGVEDEFASAIIANGSFAVSFLIAPI